jgi:hypothetical protein
VKRADRRQRDLGAIELIEQAIHQLRAAPPATLASYYLGTLPFVLGLLFFWADMSRSAFAEQHLAGAALGVAALFLWMKFWQAVFARNLRASFAGEPPPPLGWRRSCRIFIAQAAVQPSGLFLLPLALILTLPFAWVCAFYQNVTALAEAEAGEPRSLVKRASRQAALWPRQNHTLLAILSGFGFYVFLNWTTVCFVLPALAKMLLGVETIFTRSPLSLLNSTFLAAMLGLTYLSVDPIVKAAYALRCFYGESLESGEDLKAELRRLALAAQPVAACLLIALMVCGAGSASAAESPPPVAPKPAAAAAPASVSPADLERAIQEVIQQTKYAWRMPREKLRAAEADQPGIIGRFLQRVRDFLRDKIKTFLDWLGEWLRKLFRHRGESRTSGYGWMMLLEVLLYALLAAVVAGLAWLLFRLWRNRKRQKGPIAAQPIHSAPDLSDESLGAEQLPEDRWTALARELLARGELRLALRAFYFASLAHLAESNLISLAKFKSNRDYERELRRRGHSFPALLALFGENVLVIDRVWYGLHQASGEQVNRFAANVERIKTGG